LPLRAQKERPSGVRQPSFARSLGRFGGSGPPGREEVMIDSGRTARPDVFVAAGDELNGRLGPLAACLGALEARVGALERRLSAVPLMTAADAARYTRVNAETILRAVRAGKLPVAGYVGRSPDLPRCPQRLACHQPTGSAGFFAARPALRYEGKRGCLRRRGGRWAESGAAARPRPPGRPSTLRPLDG
jgi:hypothetical protein